MKTIYFSNIHYMNHNYKKFDNIFIVERFNRSQAMRRRDNIYKINSLYPPKKLWYKYLNGDYTEEKFKKEYIKYVLNTREARDELDAIIFATKEESNLIVTKNYKIKIGPILREIFSIMYPTTKLKFKDYGGIR